MKTCWKCKQTKEFIEFGRNRSKPDGLATECKPCKRKQDKANYCKNKEAIKQKSKEWYDKNKDSFTKDKKEKLRLAGQHYRKRHPDRLASKNMRRLASKINATPAWADKVAIDYVYFAAKVIERVYGTKWHVDHIIPLKGKTVCGLHVHNNLQLLAPLDNIKKSNKLGGY